MHTWRPRKECILSVHPFPPIPSARWDIFPRWEHPVLQISQRVAPELFLRRRPLPLIVPCVFFCGIFPFLPVHIHQHFFCVSRIFKSLGRALIAQGGPYALSIECTEPGRCYRFTRISLAGRPVRCPGNGIASILALAILSSWNHPAHGQVRRPLGWIVRFSVVNPSAERKVISRI